jgi:hypothetical protein
VQQGRRVDKFDYRSHQMLVVPPVPEGSGYQQNQGRTHTLAARTNNVITDRADQHNLGIEARTDHSIDFSHVFSHEGQQI